VASKQTIINILYFGLMDYVPKKKLVEYQNEYSSRKTHNTKFALAFFPKYINFDKAIKKPFSQYDTLLLNYWIIEVPNNGLKWSRLISDYEYGNSGIVNKLLKSEKNKVKTRTKLLLTKKQKEERRKKKLDLSKDPVLHGEVIRRMKIDPVYANKVKAIALKNSQMSLNCMKKEEPEPPKILENEKGRTQTFKNTLEGNKNSIDIISVIASVAKQAVAAGIEIDEAIAKTIEHFKKTIDFDVDSEDVKAKINNRPASLVRDGAIETVATILDVGGHPDYAMQKGENCMKDTDWRTNLLDNEKKKAVDVFQETVETKLNENKPKKDKMKLNENFLNKIKGVLNVYSVIDKIKIWLGILFMAFAIIGGLFFFLEFFNLVNEVGFSYREYHKVGISRGKLDQTDLIVATYTPFFFGFCAIAGALLLTGAKANKN
jgi:hypothetical protein